MQLHKQAELYIKKHSFKLWLLSSLCLKNRRKKQAFFIYAYLRWIDNTIDESNLSPSEKKEFISRQIKLIGTNEHHQKDLPLLPEELFFLQFSQYLNSIKKDILLMLFWKWSRLLKWILNDWQMVTAFLTKKT